MKNWVAAAAIASCLATAATAAQIPDDFSSLVVAGTSVSDAGNIFRITSNIPFVPTTPAIPGLEPEDERYFRGRFSNGPVWADIVGDLFEAEDKPVINVAHGGAKTWTDVFPASEAIVPDLPEQLIGAAAQAGRFGSRPLAVLEFGPNDIFEAVEDGDLSLIGNAARNILDGLKALTLAGVRDFAVFNVADLGKIPRYSLYMQDLAGEATAASRAFNAALESGLAALSLPGVRIDLIDAAALFDGLFADPGRYGIVDLVTPCVLANPPVFTPNEFSPKPPDVCDDATGRAFFDANHATRTIQAALADAVLATLDPQPTPVPAPAALPLLLAALVPLAWLHRRA